jgi:hypothetical protein
MVKKLLILGPSLLLLQLVLSQAHMAPGMTLWADQKNPKANSDPLYMSLRNVRLSGDSLPVEQVSLKRDAATITFRQGEIYFLAPVGGRVTGGVFIGEGEFQMTPMLPTEQRQLSLLTGAPGIKEKFSKLVLRFTDSTYQEFQKERRIKTGTPNSHAQAVFDDHRKLLRRGQSYSSLRVNVAAQYLHYNMEMRLLMDLTEPGEHDFFEAYFGGEHFGQMMYGIDPRGAPFVTPEEVVLVGLDDKSLGIWSATHLREHYRADLNCNDENHQLVDLEHHKIEATVKGKYLEAIVQTRFKALAEGVRVIPFDLFPSLRVHKVTYGRAGELNFIQEDKDEDGAFAVLLPEGLKRGQECTLTFEYGGNDAVADSGGGNYALIARDNWYPNSAFGDRATYDLTLKAPKDLTMVATGQLLGEDQEGNLLVSRWKSDVPLAVAGFNYGRFKKASVFDDKLKYTIETYANQQMPDSFREIQQVEEMLPSSGMQPMSILGALNSTSMMDTARAQAQTSVRLYTDMFGPLPYTRIAMTQQPSPSFGQAWPMLVYMPLSAFLDSTFRHQLGMSGGRSETFFKYVAPHEVAHQWWGHTLGWRSYRDQWMSEGFAEFSASLYAQAVLKNDEFLRFWKEAREKMFEKNRFGHRPADVGGISLGYRLDTAKTGQVTSAMMYPKGAFILHMLRMMLWDSQTGNARFSAMMKDFVNTHRNENVSTQDFANIVAKHMPSELDLDHNGKIDWFFREWVEGTSIPEYKLEYRLEEGPNGQAKLMGKISQSNVEDTFKMLVPLYADFDGKIVRLGSASLSGNSSTPEFAVLLPKKPKRVMLCDYEDVLCTIRER